MTRRLTVPRLKKVATEFAAAESVHDEPKLFGVTDGKAVGTYLERKFQAFLDGQYLCETGNAARGIDLPGLNVDIKTTSIKQPQSSCPYDSARQKIYGLGYSILVFVYDKQDDPSAQVARLNIKHAIYVDQSRTGDYQTTKGIRDILDRDGNTDDLIAFMAERHLPVDDIQAHELAKELLENPPRLGYLTISNALQWRLQYKRVIDQAGGVSGVDRLC